MRHRTPLGLCLEAPWDEADADSGGTGETLPSSAVDSACTAGAKERSFGDDSTGSATGESTPVIDLRPSIAKRPS
jgi:hypothetical protein